MTSASRAESNRLLRKWCAGVSGDVLSIGSGDDADRQGSHYRDYFTSAKSYTTSEVTEGCDLVIDVMNPGKLGRKWDAIFCSGVLEHVEDPVAALDGMRSLLRKQGTLLLGVPFRQAIHRAPEDFWRWTEYGLRVLLFRNGFVVDEIVPIDGPPTHPAAYWVRAHVG